MVASIMKNEIVIYPTDTVWGIGASIYSKEAYDRICKVKNTDPTKPVSILFPNMEIFNEYVNLENKYSVEMLEKVFKLEATIGLAITSFKKEIPKHIYGESSFICIRVLDCDEINNVYEYLKAPFITTSLNISGNPPILSEKEAKDFHNIHIQDAEFFTQKSIKMSGNSSTIINLSGEDIVIIREGNNVEKIRTVLEL